MKPIHRIFPLLLLLASLGWAASAHAGDRIFADGFEPCCRIGGTVSGLAGIDSGQLVLHLQAAFGSINEYKSINYLYGTYDFKNSVPPGDAYTVSVSTQPSTNSCIVTNASGTIGSVAIGNVDVGCGAGNNLLWNQGSWDARNWY